MKALKTLLAMTLLLTASCAQPGVPGPDASAMLSVGTDTLTERDHLILTIPPGSRESLEAASREIESRYGVRTVAEWPLNSIGVHCLVLRVGEGASTGAVVAAMAADPAIRTAQAVENFRTLANSAFPDDLSPLQSGLQEIKAREAHRMATGKKIKIAVIDTGIDFAHPDLAGSKAMEMDLVGTDPSVPPPPEQHGTAIAGVIAADASDNRGIVGVAPDAKLMGFRACWQEPGSGVGRCNSFSIARAINVAMLRKANIVNMSLGGPYDALVAELISAGQQRGIVFVAAKEEVPDAYFPASMPEVVAVRLSPSGLDRSIAAPGIDIISTAPKGGYDYFSGASVSAAHVSGVTALLLETDRSASPDRLRKVLARTRRNLDACSAMANLSRDRSAAPC